MNEAEMRQLYVDPQPGDFVEIVHHVKIGFKEYATHTVGVVVKKERRRSGMDSGFARNWDDKYWFDNSVNLDGVRAEEVKKALATDVQEELGHAQTLARRIRELGGTVPGSLAFSATQQMLQPPAEATDVLSVIKGVIDAEDAAIRQYNKIINFATAWIT